MSVNHCQFFNTEYRSQYFEKRQAKVPINRQRDCFAERIEESWQIDPLKASKITKIDDDAKNRARQLMLDTLKSVYMVDFIDPNGEENKKRKTKGKSSVSNPEEEDETNFGSELLAYINNLFHNPHDEKILAPLATAKRVFGYMRPKQFHNVLSNYQDSYGRTGSIIMTRNLELAKTSKRREALKNKKFENTNTIDPCSPEKLADMHFT